MNATPHLFGLPSAHDRHPLIPYHADEASRMTRWVQETPSTQWFDKGTDRTIDTILILGLGWGGGGKGEVNWVIDMLNGRFYKICMTSIEFSSSYFWHEVMFMS